MRAPQLVSSDTAHFIVCLKVGTSRAEDVTLIQLAMLIKQIVWNGSVALRLIALPHTILYACSAAVELHRPDQYFLFLSYCYQWHMHSALNTPQEIKAAQRNAGPASWPTCPRSYSCAACRPRRHICHDLVSITPSISAEPHLASSTLQLLLWAHSLALGSSPPVVCICVQQCLLLPAGRHARLRQCRPSLLQPVAQRASTKQRGYYCRPGCLC